MVVINPYLWVNIPTFKKKNPIRNFQLKSVKL